MYHKLVVTEENERSDEILKPIPHNQDKSFPRLAVFTDENFVSWYSDNQLFAFSLMPRDRKMNQRFDSAKYGIVVYQNFCFMFLFVYVFVCLCFFFKEIVIYFKLKSSRNSCNVKMYYIFLFLSSKFAGTSFYLKKQQN